MKRGAYGSTNAFSRREMIKVTAAGLALVMAAVVPTVSIAEEPGLQTEPIFYVDENTSVGDYIRALHPETWEQVHPDVKAMLDAEPMRLEAPSIVPARVGGYAYVNASDGFSYSTYDGAYNADETCPMLACSVTYSKGGAVYYESPTVTRSYTTWCPISGAAHIASGTYNVVITGYPIQPPPGGTVQFAQGFDTATIY